jgi:hypothetical protein
MLTTSNLAVDDCATSDRLRSVILSIQGYPASEDVCSVWTVTQIAAKRLSQAHEGPTLVPETEPASAF